MNRSALFAIVCLSAATWTLGAQAQPASGGACFDLAGEDSQTEVPMESLPRAAMATDLGANGIARTRDGAIATVRQRTFAIACDRAQLCGAGRERGTHERHTARHRVDDNRYAFV